MEREREEVFELEDVEVDRVDAVDRPATGRKWLLMKSEEEDENVALTKELEERVARALEALAAEAQKRGGLALSQDALDALNALAGLYGLSQPFASAAAGAEAVAGDDGTSAGEAAEPVAEPVAASTGDEATADEAAGTPEAEKAAASDEGYGYGYAYPDPAIWTAILEELRAIRALLEKGTVAKTQPPASRQPEPETRARHPQVRRWGEGLFADVLFGS